MNRIYELITSRGKLEDHHRAQLNVKRGFTDDTINKNRFFSSGKYLLDLEAELIKEFGEDDLIKSGVFYIPKGSTKIQMSTMLLEDRVVIPYLDASGQAYFIRPHKMGLAGVPIEIYCPVQEVGRELQGQQAYL